MYVPMYVCMYLCMYIRMYVCTYVCKYVRACVCMYVCMYVRMYVCMYVCILPIFIVYTKHKFSVNCKLHHYDRSIHTYVVQKRSSRGHSEVKIT